MSMHKSMSTIFYARFRKLFGLSSSMYFVVIYYYAPMPTATACML